MDHALAFCPLLACPKGLGYSDDMPHLALEGPPARCGHLGLPDAPVPADPGQGWIQPRDM